jgi:hypothetical protein
MTTVDVTEAVDLRVVPMTPQDEPAYAAFVAQQPEAMLYHSLAYLQLISSITGAKTETLLAVDDAHQIKGAFPILAKDGPLGRVLNSLPFYGSHGGVLAESSAAAEALTASYNELAVTEGVCAATVVANPLAAIPAPVCRHSLTDSRIGQFTRIEFDERHAENLMQSYHQKTRNMVRKGEKSGIRIEEENGQVEFLMEVHRESMRALGGRAKPDTFFRLFPRYFQVGNDYRIFVARSGGEPVAALLLFYFRDTVEYYMPVIREAHRDRQPLSLLIHHAMTHASMSGYRLWNWGGTWPTQHGVYLFKKRWNTHDINYTYFVQANSPAVFASSKEALLEHYPDFFVVPFHMLTSHA